MTLPKAASLFLILSLLLFACTSTKVVKKSPEFRITETTLAKGIDEQGTRPIPRNPTTFTSQSLGLHLVTILGEDQLKGKITMSRRKGTRVRIRFKVG
jgi:hypothetical protein